VSSNQKTKNRKNYGLFFQNDVFAMTLNYLRKKILLKTVNSLLIIGRYFSKIRVLTAVGIIAPIRVQIKKIIRLNDTVMDIKILMYFARRV